MSPAEISVLISRKDNSLRKQIFETHYPAFSVIARRYSKNAQQAGEALNHGFISCFNRLTQMKNARAHQLAEVIRPAFIEGLVSYIRSIRSEYYVSSTVYAVESPRGYSLFESTDVPDYNAFSTDAYISALQHLVPSQRLIFNLCVIDGYSVDDAAAMLESSVQTVKSNLEKARYNLQKNIASGMKPNSVQA